MALARDDHFINCMWFEVHPYDNDVFIVQRRCISYPKSVNILQLITHTSIYGSV